MYSSVKIDTLIISLLLSTAFISLFILTILRCFVFKKNKYFNKNYTALLINFNQMIEMKIPMIKQKDKHTHQYSIPIHTETFHSCDETDYDFHQSMLSMSELPYYSVRETTFQKDPKIKPQMIIDPNQEKYSYNNKIFDV